MSNIYLYRNAEDITCGDPPGDLICGDPPGGMICSDPPGDLICDDPQGHIICDDLSGDIICHDPPGDIICDNLPCCYQDTLAASIDGESVWHCHLGLLCLLNLKQTQLVFLFKIHKG